MRKNASIFSRMFFTSLRFSAFILLNNFAKDLHFQNCHHALLGSAFFVGISFPAQGFLAVGLFTSLAAQGFFPVGSTIFFSAQGFFRSFISPGLAACATGEVKTTRNEKPRNIIQTLNFPIFQILPRRQIDEKKEYHLRELKNILEIGCAWRITNSADSERMHPDLPLLKFPPIPPENPIFWPNLGVGA